MGVQEGPLIDVRVHHQPPGHHLSIGYISGCYGFWTYNRMHVRARACKDVSKSGVRHESDKEECEKRKREVTMGFVPHRPY